MKQNANRKWEAEKMCGGQSTINNREYVWNEQHINLANEHFRILAAAHLYRILCVSDAASPNYYYRTTLLSLIYTRCISSIYREHFPVVRT